MPAPFDHRRRPEPLLRRGTVLGGAVLGTVLLLVLGVLGGITLPSVGSATTEEPERSMGSSGPLVAVQPRPSSPTGPPLLEAAPLPPPAPPAAASSAPPSPPPSPTPAPEQGRLAALCRALFENPTDLWELLGSLARRPATSQPDPGTPAPTAVAWEEDTPDRSRPDWLRQVLHVFDPDRVESAYQRLRDSVDQCGKFAATLPDGTPVTVWLQRVVTSPQGRVDEAYTAEFIAATPTGVRTGWLALDRVGPVVSLLSAFSPEGQDPARWAAEREALRRAIWRELLALLPRLR